MQEILHIQLISMIFKTDINASLFQIKTLDHCIPIFLFEQFNYSVKMAGPTK